MSDVKMVKFRGAMGGYSKKDVNRYIEQISIDFARREEMLKGDIESEKRKVSEAKSRIEELTHMLDELACEAYSSENAASLANDGKSAAEARGKELSQMLDELACRLYAAEAREAELKSALAGMADRIAGYESRESGEKLSEEVAEKIRNKTEELLRHAGEEAGRIISTAEEKAAEMVSAASEKADAIINDAKVRAGAEEGKIKKMYSSAAEDYCEQIRKLTAEMTKTADSQPEKEEKKPLQSEKPTTLDDRIDTFFRVLFSQINPKNKGKN